MISVIIKPTKYLNAIRTGKGKILCYLLLINQKSKTFFSIRVRQINLLSVEEKIRVEARDVDSRTTFDIQCYRVV